MLRHSRPASPFHTLHSICKKAMSDLEFEIDELATAFERVEVLPYQFEPPPRSVDEVFVEESDSNADFDDEFNSSSQQPASSTEMSSQTKPKDIRPERKGNTDW